MSEIFWNFFEILSLYLIGVSFTLIGLVDTLSESNKTGLWIALILVIWAVIIVLVCC